MTRLRTLACTLATVSATAALASASPALAQTLPSTQASWWRLTATPAPTNLPRTGEAQLVVTASNLGDEEVPTGENVTLTDALPPGASAQAVEGLTGTGKPLTCSLTAQTVSCSYAGGIPPYDKLIMRITVAMEDPSAAPLNDSVTLLGGAVTWESLSKQLNVGAGATAFGVEAYELTPEDEHGRLDTQAGAHPFQLTTTLNFNETLADYSNEADNERGEYPSSPALPRSLHFKLPPGLVGDATAVPECSDADFSVDAGGAIDLCPADTAVGVASVVLNDPIPIGFGARSVPVFNLVPSPGEPARFGFDVDNVPVVLKTAVPSGGAYAVEVSVENISQAVQVLSSQVTLWGVPGDARHDDARGWACLLHGYWVAGKEVSCENPPNPEPVAFLTLPTLCGEHMSTSVSGSSWPTAAAPDGEALGAGEAGTYESPDALTGCGALPFSPTISVEPEVKRASSPTGLNVSVTMAQTATLDGAAPVGEADVRTTTVALPAGLAVNPGAANGLEACTAQQFGFDFPGGAESEQTLNQRFSAAPATCANASKVGTVSIETPLLAGQKLTGAVYLADEDTNLVEEKLVLYLLAEDPTAGILVKLAGTVKLDPGTGQLISTFENTPRLPFSRLELHFFGGSGAGEERMSVTTPPECGAYTTDASFTPWSSPEGQAATPSASFAIDEGAGGGPCPSNPQPFTPSAKAGSANVQAAALTHFTLTIERPDSDQALTGVEAHLPPGVAALLAGVTPCAEPASASQEWSCGPQSLIGHSSASSGLGGEPVTLPGEVYLTKGYDGAPFGLLVATRAQAGPFDLGMVYVRSRVEVNPSTAAVSIVTDPGPHDDAIPTMLRGVPVQLKTISVSTDREDFMFNPTSCAQLKVETTLIGAAGARAQSSYPFHVNDCTSLPFAPTLSALAGGHASKADGDSLNVKVTSPGLGQSSIAKVDLQLPAALPSRLSTLQKACPEATFDANPATCDEASVIGTATVRTPILASPLSGPAYLVSHGNAAFPDIEFVLQGEGITLVLDGKTDIKSGITYSRFETVPDAPFTSFETSLPAGPHSVLTAYVQKTPFDLCATSLVMPTTLTAESGAVITQQTKVAVSGCDGVAAYKVTKAQELAKALKSCRKDKRKRKRVACERAARKKYGAAPAKKSKKKSKRG